MGRRWDYIAWNTAAERVFTPGQQPPPYSYNIIWRIFTNPDRRLVNPGWEKVARNILAQFRAESARYANDHWFKQLISDLERESPEFRKWWPLHDVGTRIDGRKEIAHPIVGCLVFEHSTLQVPTNPDLKVMIYTPYPNTDTTTKLCQLMKQSVYSV
jgi:hypothetical protein